MVVKRMLKNLAKPLNNSHFPFSQYSTYKGGHCCMASENREFFDWLVFNGNFSSIFTINQLINQSMKYYFIEHPKVNQICLLHIGYIMSKTS